MAAVRRLGDGGVHQIVPRPGELGEHERLVALQSRDCIRGKEPTVERSRLQNEIAGLTGVDVGKDMVVAED